MYTACLFCQSDLGRNEAIEAFPVGRRLAYDQAKGRLWVVCRKCERWNLTPLEERWEAMEQAERLYRGTRLRASTGNVGLARLKDGTELVRIGQPLRPEFAAWRYGDQFGRRRNRRLLLLGGVAVATTAVVVAGPVAGLFSLGASSQLFNLFNILNGANTARRTRKRIDIAGADGRPPLHVSLFDAATARLESDAGGFALRVGARTPSWGARRSSALHGELRFAGAEAVRVAARLLPHVNSAGGSPVDVREAVALLDASGAPDALFTQIAVDARRHRSSWRHTASPGGTLQAMTPAARLALEMAAHEEQERRALEGELRELETAWAQAEEIAAIADDLLLPEAVGAKLDQLKASSGRSSARAGAPSSPTSESGAASSS